APTAALGACDVIFLCTPVAAIEALLAPVSCHAREGAILTDVGGAKARVVAVASREVRPGVAFVGAHPMFGGHGGYAAARAELWRGGRVAVCTDAVGDPRAVDVVAGIHAALGAEVIRCAAAEHDAAVAMVSHLPYLVASAFSLAARDAGPLAERLAGPGLRDLTRLAQFPFDIQGEVARRNDGIAAAAQSLQDQLSRVLDAVAASPERARAVLEEARAAREALYPGGNPA
ncbi:MAG TPA: prephenate dehydrogenase/arogenate dehydrogenase family protein, partial [Anaeromyxobacteraceae bacterium]|nr:prephenate dehydrogenase/arogenate dehydrogenase family protein [Anaeromyxobacteraceae bacterium]